MEGGKLAYATLRFLTKNIICGKEGNTFLIRKHKYFYIRCKCQAAAGIKYLAFTARTL
jgi:hypothetical protein